MNERLIVQLCEIILAVAAFGSMAAIIAATWYDMRAIAQKRRLQAITTKLFKSQQPPIAVLIYTHNDASAIEQSLDSIVNATYENYRVVVADHSFSGNAKQVASAYKITHPAIPITIYSPRSSADRLQILQAAYRKARKNELLLILNAGDQLSPNAMRTSATRFIANRRLDALKLRPHTQTDITLSTLVTHFTELTMNIFNKALPLNRVNAHAVDRSRIIMRGDLFTQSPSHARPTAMYSSAATFRPGRTASTATSVHELVAATGRLAALFIIIGLLSYFFYTAAMLKSNALLTLSWLLVSLWLIAVVWSDDLTKLADKFALTFTVPFMYFVLYLYCILAAIKAPLRYIAAIRLPAFSIHRLTDAFYAELYSTRY